VASVVGELDPGFNGSGIVLYDYVDDDMVSKDDRASAVEVDGKGRIVVAISGMYQFYASDDQFDMAAITMRLLPDGTPDATYQSGALSGPGLTVDTTSRWSHANDLVLDDKGIVLCGYREWGNADDPTIYRYQETGGQPDGFFGTSGAAQIPAGSGEDQAWGIAIDPTDTNYVVVGSESRAAMRVSKISSTDGAMDTSFAGSGTLVYDVAGDEHGEAVVVDDQGRIYVAGHMSAGAAADIAVWRYLGNGSLDPAFSGDGIFTYDSGGDDEKAMGISLDANGDVIVVGTTKTSGEANDLAVLKISSATGELDSSFGTQGVFRYGSDKVDEGYGLLVASDGIFVTGTSGLLDGTQAMAVWKFTPAGTLDPSFAGTGESTTPGVFLTSGSAGGNNDIGHDLAIDSAGRIVVAGQALASDGFYSAAVWTIR
jgi:uncharacterized delta-60 repeat protein